MTHPPLPETPVARTKPCSTEPRTDHRDYEDSLVRCAALCGTAWARCGLDVRRMLRDRLPHWPGGPALKRRLAAAVLAAARRVGRPPRTRPRPSASPHPRVIVIVIEPGRGGQEEQQ